MDFKGVLCGVILAMAMAGCSTVRLAEPAPSDAEAMAHKPAQASCDYRLWQHVLDHYVVEGYVDYERLKADPDDLKTFIGQLGRCGPASTPNEFPDDRSRLAYWINAYDAFAMLAAMKNHPRPSVKPVLGEFADQVLCRIDKQWLRLSQIADRAATAGKGDPRIRLALIDPAKGSGKLSGTAFTPEHVDTQIVELYQQALADPAILQINHERQALQLGRPVYDYRRQYVERYRTRFGTDKSGTIINALADDATAQERRKLNSALGYRIVPMPYDWSLNEWVRPKCSLD